MSQFLLFVGAVMLVAVGRMVAPPPEPERPRVEPEPTIAAAVPAAPIAPPGGAQPAPAQGG
jgi:hypothetical protein